MIALTENERTVLAFLKALEEPRHNVVIDTFYHPEAEQTEYPNAITKVVTHRNPAQLKEASVKGWSLMSSQTFEVKNMLSIGDSVILEAVWKGILAVPSGNLHVGEEIVAYFAQFFEFKDGKIFRQRNYDCFEPFR